MKIGVIAEEDNDVEVLYELTCKLVNAHSFSFRKFLGHGCGMMRRKCTAWAENLLRRGCTHLVVLHDLDNKVEGKLRSELDRCVQSLGFNGYVILIPVHEIEAWLLVDANAIKSVFHMKKTPKLPTSPEDLLHPKEKLRDIIWKETQKYYVNTIHNKRIAAASHISKVKACKSFRLYPNFITSHAKN
ncbi:MAG: DUF4276 family protein [Sedimentisphaerales bacterium]|jgi:hypothetical protein